MQAGTWEQVNRLVIGHAMANRIESGRATRTDCTVVESNIHEPSCSLRTRRYFGTAFVCSFGR